MGQIKIDGGTPKHHGEHLCLSCSCCQHIRGAQMDHDVVLCHTRGNSPPRHIKWVVTQCNDYEDKRQPALWQMEKIAWRFSVDNKKKTAGFLTPAQWKAMGKDSDD
jgi:hypothetical protein